MTSFASISITYITINPVQYLDRTVSCNFCFPLGQISLKKRHFNVNDTYFTCINKGYIKLMSPNIYSSCYLVIGMIFLAQNGLKL